ncbi:hypothetical protein FACS189425_01430 [Clostridia bacterium]|nr:hypothetical protein FACS189425_01430 [Clostridia bacterium]
MAVLKHAYETIIVVDSTKSQEDIDSIIEKFKAIISKDNTIDSIDVWGNRRLAYPINDLKEGYYVLINFTSDADLPKELDRVYKITDGVLRTIIIRKDERYLDYEFKAPKAPAARSMAPVAEISVAETPAPVVEEAPVVPEVVAEEVAVPEVAVSEPVEAPAIETAEPVVEEVVDTVTEEPTVEVTDKEDAKDAE